MLFRSIVHPTMQRVGGLETINSFLGNAAALSDASGSRGAAVASGRGVECHVPKSRGIRHEAAIAITYVLAFDRALPPNTPPAPRPSRAVPGA